MSDRAASPPTTATCRVIRSAASYEGKQGPTYAGGVSAETAGSSALWLGRITIAPGGRTRAHYHANHETAILVLEGEADMWSGPELATHDVVRAGECLYIPAGISHVAANRSLTEPLIAVAARTDPNEQESVVLQPELDDKAR
jgi:uncharacterized RmlC-like cupin family protein